MGGRHLCCVLEVGIVHDVFNIRTYFTYINMCECRYVHTYICMYVCSHLAFTVGLG